MVGDDRFEQALVLLQAQQAAAEQALYLVLWLGDPLIDRHGYEYRLPALAQDNAPRQPIVVRSVRRHMGGSVGARCDSSPACAGCAFASTRPALSVIRSIT